MTLQVVTDPSLMRQLSRSWKADGLRVSLVPTMGALHAGHLDLMRKARDHADRVVVSIFVNPTQFGPKEDFALYPRMLEADTQKLKELGVDALFAPLPIDMYPAGFASYITAERSADILCGHFRPGHFRGVLTIVAKLFNCVEPDIACFGKKDYQQLALIKQMAQDLNFGLEVRGCETLRDPDGLAMSSRNLRLTPEERLLAPSIFSAMQKVQTLYRHGERRRAQLESAFREALSASPAFRIEYAEVRSQSDLSDAPELVTKSSVLLVAAYLGSVRLIDNWELQP